MDATTQARTRRGPPAGGARSPANPRKVLDIVRLKDDQALTFDAIALQVGGTRMNCCALYNRWVRWARARRAAAE
jgi:hypothetical protein